MRRLSEEALSGLPAGVTVPGYDRTYCGVGIVHLGIGAFHRAHQAVYTDDVLAIDGGDWAIVGVSLRDAGMRERMGPQDGLYSVTVRSGGEERQRVIGAVKGVLFGPEDPRALLALLAAPSTRIVSLTVTEKGYCREPSSGALLRDDPEVRRDLEHPDSPVTALGTLVRALDLRRQGGLPPFTVLSCDNLPDNGTSLRRVALEFAGLVSTELAAWIEASVAFPCTMVDRIVPAMTEEALGEVAASLGCRDEAAVVTEPFTQWVIEDHFTLGRPAWEKAGALLVPDVAPYEVMKLRLLNGAHSTLAYLGYLGGMEHIADCMAHDDLRAFIGALLREEISPTLAPPPGFDVPGYIDDLLARFANPVLRHRTWQIAMDGSQKLPQRLLGAIRERLEDGLPIPRLTLAVAGWVRYACGTDLAGGAIDVRDPLADLLRGRLQPVMEDPEALAGAALGVREVFGAELGDHGPFRAALARGLATIAERGPLASAAMLAAP